MYDKQSGSKSKYQTSYRSSWLSMQWIPIEEKSYMLIIERTTFSGTDACADPEFFSKGSEGYFIFSGDGIQGIL